MAIAAVCAVVAFDVGRVTAKQELKGKEMEPNEFAKAILSTHGQHLDLRLFVRALQSLFVDMYDYDGAEEDMLTDSISAYNDYRNLGGKVDFES